MESMITKFPPIRSFVAGVFLFLLLGALARQAAADLYVADSETNAVYRYTPDGVQHTFVSIPQPVALAFDTAKLIRGLLLPKRHLQNPPERPKEHLSSGRRRSARSRL